MYILLAELGMIIFIGVALLQHGSTAMNRACAPQRRPAFGLVSEPGLLAPVTASWHRPRVVPKLHRKLREAPQHVARCLP